MGRWAAYRLLRRLPSLSKPSSVPLYPSQFSLLSSDPTIQFFPFKPFSSSASSSSTALAHDFDYGFRDLSHFYVDEDRETAKIPVKAYFLSTRLALFTFLLLFRLFLYLDSYVSCFLIWVLCITLFLCY